MSTVNDYAKNQNSEINSANYSELDALVFAELSYVNFESVKLEENMSLSDFAEIMYEHYKSPSSNFKKNPDLENLLRNISENPRYENCTISNLKAVNSDTEQWAGITVHLNDPQNTVVVSFRGTDGTETGWKEDFELAYGDDTDAQRSSQAYLEAVAKANPNANINLSGHSKGGNDAIYAYIASSEDVRNQVNQVHNFDGPGVMGEQTERYAQGYAELDGKLTTYCPQDSMIGMLMEDHGNIVFVSSDGSSSQAPDAGALGQHDAFTWQIDGNGEFVPTEQSEMSQYINRLLDETLNSLTVEERKELINLLEELGVFSLIPNPKGTVDSELMNLIMKLIRGDRDVDVQALVELLQQYSELTEAQKAVLIKVVSTIYFRVLYDSSYIESLIYKEIDQWAEAQQEKIDQSFDKIETTLRVLGFTELQIELAREISKLLIEGISVVAKGFVKYVRDRLLSGSDKSYSKDVLFVNLGTLQNVVQKLQQAQRLIKSIDGSLDELKRCFQFYEVIDKTSVAVIDYTMTSASLGENMLEHLFNEGYDWEITKSINFLTTVMSQLEQNERRLLTHINVL